MQRDSSSNRETCINVCMNVVLIGICLWRYTQHPTSLMCIVYSCLFSVSFLHEFRLCFTTSHFFLSSKLRSRNATSAKYWIVVILYLCLILPALITLSMDDIFDFFVAHNNKIKYFLIETLTLPRILYSDVFFFTFASNCWCKFEFCSIEFYVIKYLQSTDSMR